MKSYDPKKIEKKWQKHWLSKKIYNADDKSKKKKYYSLIEFPYPSGEGLHVGHPRPYIGMDIISRKKRMDGFNVLYPIGWDAFGLPTENYAIKTGKDPRVVTKKNTDNFRKQIQSIGISFDWSREINTTDPKYYKWTQWLFLQFLKHDLAYKAKININWCPKDKTGLANEEVVNGCCERCGTPVEKREKEQWMLAITKYADRLYKDLDDVDYLPQIKLSQRNWIGRSEGAEIEFDIKGEDKKIKVFTTRPDTIFGATYLVIAPEHRLVSELGGKITNQNEVAAYIKSIKDKTDIERMSTDKVKTGVELKGIKAINPGSKEEIPVWIADYVLATYGTGAIMAVPAHDERDYEFAKKFKLPITQVVMPNNTDSNNPPREGKKNTERHVVQVILKNKKNEYFIEYLKDPKWGDLKPTTFIIGGVEEGEDSLQAAEREVEEETGYTDFKLVQKIPFNFQSNFFAAHKDVNRKVFVDSYVFELNSDKKGDIREDEFFNKDSHEAKWIPERDVEKTLTTEDQKMTWRFYQSGGYAFGDAGLLINSGQFNGKMSEEAKKEIVTYVGGKEKVSFKLRDWVFSRQRYWGEPIPVVHCEKCGIVALPEKELPLELPKVKNYQPTDNGESPLANIAKWVNTKCPTCKGPAKRETDTMPNWAGSSWYFIRYADTKNNKVFADPKKIKTWLPVDWYNGGNEHTTLHLLYSRFWYKFLYDLKLVPNSEPYMKRTSHGLILAADGEKMSKSRGNVVNPNEIVARYGADAFRLYMMFMGPFDQAISWSENTIVGTRRFVERVWGISGKLSKETSPAIAKLLHKTIKKVGEDIEGMRFNTAISSMMVLVNEIEKGTINKADYKKLLKIIAPFAPHMADELWSVLGEKKSINISLWPEFDPKLLVDDEIKIVIQVNGKLRGEVMVAANDSEETVKEKALKEETIIKHLEGKTPKKIIYVKGRLINIVI